MPASKNDKFMKVGGAPGTATTLSAPGYTIGNTSINVGSTSNWSTDTGITFAIDTVSIVNGAEVRDAGSYNEYVGTVASGTQITNVQWVAGSGDRNYTAGATTRVYIGVTANRENRIVEGLVVQHNQDGTHKSLTTDTLTTTGNVTIGGTLTIGGAGSDGGWSPISGTVSAVTYNGNRSYSLTTSADNTGSITPGMRLRTTRTVAAPTQSTSLNGTNQYWNDTTVAGMTFTDDFTVSAWVKLSSYSQGTIASRWNGTSGWRLSVEANGTVNLYGYNGGSGNFSGVATYQSIPLNKWIHIAVQLDMSAFTATATTSYIMLDGVDVPASVSRGGTNPTALIQAGNLEIGAHNSGLYPFPGKIAQAAIFSAKVTQATMRGYISQGLAGTETGLVSAYSFNGTANDLNTTNANNLTAQNAATATNADSPFGGQADGTISSTKDYGIVQKITASTITVQVAEGCTIPTSGGVSAVSYSTYKSPFGFPGQKERWTVGVYYKSSMTQSSPTASTYYNIGSMKNTVPIGEWTVRYEVPIYYYRAGNSVVAIATLSTSSSAETDTDLSTYTVSVVGGSTSVEVGVTSTRSKWMSLSAQTPVYFLAKGHGVSLNTITVSGDLVMATITAENAYL